MELSIPTALNQAIVAQRSGKLEEAKQIYQAILKKHPRNPDANHNMGVIAAGSTQFKNASDYFEKAIESNPKVPQYWLSYLNLLINLRQFEGAKAVYRRAEKQGVTEDPFAKIRLTLNISSQPVNDGNIDPLSERSLNTKEVALQAGIHKDTLLRWLRNKVVTEPARDHRGWRTFSLSEAQAIKFYAQSGHFYK